MPVPTVHTGGCSAERAARVDAERPVPVDRAAGLAGRYAARHRVSGPPLLRCRVAAPEDRRADLTPPEARVKPSQLCNERPQLCYFC